MAPANTVAMRLARFACELAPEQVPKTVVQRARLQHLGFAGAVRRLAPLPFAQRLAADGGRRGAARLATGGTAPARDAVRLHSALGGGFGWDDHLFAGHTSAGGVSAAWAAAKGHTVDDLLCATVAANEVAGRLGAALLIGPDHGEAWGQVHALAAATAAGRLAGLDACTLAHAMALAVSGAAHIPLGVLVGEQGAGALAIAHAVQQGFDAVALAKKGAHGPLDAIEAKGGVLDAGCWLPLRAAFTGLGTAWLTQTLAYKLFPLADPWQAAMQAVQSILDRHVKAADRRLRADQIIEIEVKMGAPGWALGRRIASQNSTDTAALHYALPRAIGVLVVAHEMGPDQRDEAWWQTHGEAVESIASRVRLAHDWKHTVDVTRGLVEVFAPLLAGVTASELRAVSGQSTQAHGRLPTPGVADLITIAKARPDRLLERIRYASGDLADARVDEWQLRLGADVRISTTRGGSWPASRDIAEASPGWSWSETHERVCEKYGGDDPVARQRAVESLKTEGSEPAQGWVRQLLS